MKRLLSRTYDVLRSVATLDRGVESALINQGRILTHLNLNADYTNLSDFEFKVFSQGGEDGIIQHIVNAIDLTEKTFVEFGVESFSESNCRFLMMKDSWRGLVIDGSARNIERLKRSYYFWRYDLTAICSFITKENIAELLKCAPFSDVGILSIDIDGVDWFILKELAHVQPGVLIVEYNALFGSKAAVTVPYDPAFQRAKAHYSNLYYGASLAAIDMLASKQGFGLIGCNSAGNNAFFVRNDLLNATITRTTVAEAYRRPRFREARDAEGHLTFDRGECGRREIADLPLLDVATGSVMRVRDIDAEV